MQGTRWIAASAVLLILQFNSVTRAGTVARPESLVPKTEELRGGRWVTVAEPTTQAAPLDPALRRVEDLLNNHQNREASKACVRWLLANVTSPLRDRALYLNAEALYRYGNRIKSFFYLDELMDEYPDSPLFYNALEKQYQIADAFLPDQDHKGYKTRFMLIPFVGRQDEAVEMLYRIQQRSPGSPLAERALLRTADYYYFDGQFDLAGDTYGAYARNYPRSPLLARVKLREAYSNLAQFRGPKFDATPAIDARAQLTAIVVAYPELAQQENLPDLIAQIDTRFAQKLLTQADFYRRTHEPVAAVYTYRFLVKAYPQSNEARTAQAALDRMPRHALDSPPPAGGSIGSPSTQPSASAR